MPAARRPPPFAALGCALVALLGLSGCAAGLAETGAALGLSSGGGRLQRVGIGRVAIFTVSTRPPSPGQPARFGDAGHLVQTVTIPPSRRAGTIERPTLLRENPRSHYTLAARRPMAGDAFRAELAERLRHRTGAARDALVYVHGFNTGYQEATFRLAQVVADADFAGIPVLFTWPSRESLLAYGGDREIATSSRDQMEKLFVDLAALPNVGRIHVLAHSMGAWLAMEGLRQATLAGHRDLGGKLGEVMLAAPDIDLDVFRQQIARVGSPSRFTVFSATDDRALQVSSILAGERTRLGAIDLTNAQNRALVERLGVRVIDLTSIEGVRDLAFRHGTYAEAPTIVALIGSKLNAPPAEPPVPPTEPVQTSPLPGPEVAGAPGALPIP